MLLESTQVQTIIREISADLDWIIAAHALLKIPTRILMRVTEFKVLLGCLKKWRLFGFRRAARRTRTKKQNH